MSGLRVYRCRVVRRLPGESAGRQVVALVAAPSVRTAARLLGLSPLGLIRSSECIGVSEDGQSIGSAHQAELALAQPGVVLFACPTVAHDRAAIWHTDLKKEPNLWVR